MTPLEIARNESIPVVTRISRLLTIETLGHRGFFGVLATIVERELLASMIQPDQRSARVARMLRDHAESKASLCDILTVYSEAEIAASLRSITCARVAVWAAYSVACSAKDPENTKAVSLSACVAAGQNNSKRKQRQQLNDIIAVLEAQHAGAS